VKCIFPAEGYRLAAVRPLSVRRRHADRRCGVAAQLLLPNIGLQSNCDNDDILIQFSIFDLTISLLNLFVASAVEESVAGTICCRL